MPNGTPRLRPFFHPLLYSICVLFVPSLLALTAGAGALSPAGVAGAFFLSSVVALLLFAPIAFVVALVVRSWRARTLISCALTGFLFVMASLWRGLRVHSGEEAFGVLIAAALALVLVIGQGVFVIAWERSSRSPAPAGAT